MAFRNDGTVEGDHLANERLEGGLVNFFSFVDVDRAAYVSVETRVEETGRILQRRALGEGKLHDILVGFASADDAVVRPNRSAHPLPLLDDVRVCFLDELAHSAEGFPAPVSEFGDSFRDELRCRMALARACLFHVLLHVEDLKKSGASQGQPAQELISKRIAELGDWRGETLGRMRQLIKEADPDVVEEWKWMGTPVWSHDGIICTGESYKKVVKLTFAKGAALKDPTRLFN